MTDPILQELQQLLAEGDRLGDDDREQLEELLGRFQQISAELEADPAIDAAELARRREVLRTNWVNYYEACQKVALNEDNLLLSQEKLADKFRAATMTLLRINHAKKKAIENGEFAGTWERLEEEKELIAQVDADRDAWLQRLTADDIRELEDEGVLD